MSILYTIYRCISYIINKLYGKCISGMLHICILYKT